MYLFNLINEHGIYQPEVKNAKNKTQETSQTDIRTNKQKQDQIQKQTNKTYCASN